MARYGFDDKVRREAVGAASVEGLLAYAMSRPRWAALRGARRAVAMARDLAAADPQAYTGLLSRALRTTAGLLLRRRRPEEALPLAEEAVVLARRAGGAPLVVSLACLAQVLEALDRYGEAAAASSQAAREAADDEE
ncbi:hypothetical protein [Nonomuraea longicatena]|uniref:Uncharacterized protein n=1 Tax=Nonomuraea longicatena TaxID=83682 RepID=A0ABN1NMN4_9ACTN